MNKLLLLLLAIVACSSRICHAQDLLRGGAAGGWKFPWPWHHKKHHHADVSDTFPSLDETLEMARLSSLVYYFKEHNETYCADYHSDDGLSCQYYVHDLTLGTQVMVVTQTRLKYIAIVFAGTDDLRTSLADADIREQPFGNNNSGVYLDDAPDVKIHAGFDNAVFSNVTLWKNITSLTKSLVKKNKHFRLFTTGHSLGGANAVLTAVALTLDEDVPPVVSISFGCPQTGNIPWFEYFNRTTSMADAHARLREKLGVWRVVLGWDLVPRLPQFFSHVGHTLQLWNVPPNGTTPPVEAYYQHFGDVNLNLSSVPAGWYSKSFIWVPSSLTSHFVKKYIDRLELLQTNWPSAWPSSFVKVPDQSQKDDDDWVEPPDDTYPLSYFNDRGRSIDRALAKIEASNQKYGPPRAHLAEETVANA